MVSLLSTYVMFNMLVTVFDMLLLCIRVECSLLSKLK